MPTTADIWGYADLHCHPMAHHAFGGLRNGKCLFWGEPTGSPQVALACCDPSHSTWSTFLPCLIELGFHGSRGEPGFQDWPRHETLLHQQMYIDWIRRAYDSGLRLLCALAVNNEYLAYRFHKKRHSNDRDGAAITRQLDGLKTMVADPTVSPWMAIATSAGEARKHISDGKLAVVLGIEVDLVGGWRSPDDCTDDDARGKVDDLWARGVRMMTPIHLANNAMGGCQVNRDTFNILNHWLHGEKAWYEIDQACSTPELRGVEMLLGKDPEEKAVRNAYAAAYPFDKYSGRIDGHVNRVGLSDRGKTWIQRMMKHGMMIDIDHMSQRSRDATLALAEDRGYPLVSSHTTFRALGLSRGASGKMHGVKHEGMLSQSDVSRIRQLGGVVGLMSRQGPIVPYVHPSQLGLPSVPKQDTSLSWAHAYLYAIEHLGDDAGIGIGTDFNGLAGQPGPRFRGPKPIGSSRKIVYGNDLLVQTQHVLQKAASLGTKAFDLNTDGLAHYGLLPDFLRDVANQYDSDQPLVPFFRSAQRFIEAWERCEKAGASLVP